jgi:hypothetical protein
MQDMEYAGFWIRVCASLIDSLLMLVIIFPALSFIYGMDYWLSERFIHACAWWTPRPARQCPADAWWCVIWVTTCR